jgi:hypothetical protein
MGRPAIRRLVELAVAAMLLAAVAAGLHPAPPAAASPPVRLAAPLLYPLGLDPFSLSVAETPSGEVYALATGMDPSYAVADALYKVPLGIEGQDYVRVDRLTTAAQPQGGVLRDMDGDGLLEALVSAAGEVRLYDWEGFKGTLREVWSAAGTCDPILPGDFDEDGTLDFVGVSASGGSVSVYLGNGDCTFTAGQSNTYPISYMTAALGDFNGDGHDDIAAVPNDNDLYILRGDGAGQFATPLHVAESYALMGVDVADFNGDGKDDVVSTAGTNVAVLLGNGDCTFSGALLPVTDDLTRVAACDWDGDGDDDAVGFTDDDEGWADVLLASATAPSPPRARATRSAEPGSSCAPCTTSTTTGARTSSPPVPSVTPWACSTRDPTARSARVSRACRAARKG